MTSVSRNSPCPCGSGKKYKRCCINKDKNQGIVPTPEKLHEAFEAAARKQDADAKKGMRVFNKYNSAKVLKVLALLQTQPLNHGKNIRLEIATVEVIKNLNHNADSFSLKSLTTDLKKTCKRHYTEDPPEEFFTENIIYSNGNNIVFPGISTNGTEIVQGLINSFSQRDHFPAKFIEETNAGVLLILHIHNVIAKNLGLTHRMFIENTGDDLFIPEEKVVSEMAELFVFDKNKIGSYCEELKIPIETFEQFVYDIEKKGHHFDNGNDSPLLQQPFIGIDDKFVLVMPTAELACLNDFIVNLASRHNCLTTLVSFYSQLAAVELYPYLRRMQWDAKKFNFSGAWRDKRNILQETLWGIDSNKLAYVSLITEVPSFNKYINSGDNLSKAYTDRIESRVVLIKSQYPDHEIMVVTILHKSRLLEVITLGFNYFKNAESQIFFSLLELQILIRVWKFDRLTIWKYEKYFRLAEDRIHFAPLNTHYSKFDWYVRNGESFFDPDKEPFTFATFGFEIESEIKRKGLLKLDKLGIEFFDGREATFVQCFRKEEYYSAYISQEVNVGIFRSCLLKYSFPIWFLPIDGPHSLRRSTLRRYYIGLTSFMI